MAENFGIVVEIDPAKAARGIDALDAKLESLEKTAKEVGDKIGQALASGLTGSKAFTAQQDAASKAARAQEREATQARRTQEREAKAAAAAQTKAARDAERAQVSAAKGAAREQAKAAREAAAAQKREAAAATAALEKEARRQVAIERQKDPLQAAALIGLPGGGAKGGKGAGGAVAGLSSGLAAVGGAAAAVAATKEVLALADSYTTLTNRLTTVTKNEGELALVRQELFEISNRTRTDINDTAQLYSTFGKKILETGRSHKDVLPIIESLQQAVKLSGASSEAASASLIQLGQGMATGTLRGEELNSVIEQTPGVADVIAKQLGVTSGALKALGEQGKITTEQIIAGFQTQKDEIANKYAKTLPTVSDQWVVFRNELKKAIGEFNKNGEASKIAGAALSKLTEILKTAGKGIGIIVEIFQKLYGVVESVTGAVRPLYDALNGFSNGYIAKGFSFLADQIKAAIIPFERIVQLYNFLFPEKQDLAAEAEAAKTITKVGDELVKENVRSDTSKTGTFSGDVDYGRVLQDMDKFIKLGEGARKKGERAIKTATGQNILESEAKKAAEAAAKLREEYDRFADSADPVGKALRELAEAEKLVAKAQAAGVPGAERGTELLARKRDILKDQIDPYAAVVRELTRENKLLGLTDAERERTVKLLELENRLRDRGATLTEAQWLELDRLLKTQQEDKVASEARTAAFERQNQILDGLYQKQDAYYTGLADLKVLLDEGYISMQQYTTEVGKLRQEYGEIVKTPLDQYWEKFIPSEAAIEAAQAIRSQFIEVIADLGRGLQDLALAGKGSFEQLATDAITAIQRILIKMLALKAVEAIFGSNSGAFNLVGGALGLTSGGNRAAGGSFLVGGSGGTDSQGVFLRATPGERVTVSRPESASAGAANVTVPVRVINVTDPRAALDVMSGPDGEQVIMNVIDRRAGAIRQRLDQS